MVTRRNKIIFLEEIIDELYAILRESTDSDIIYITSKELTLTEDLYYHLKNQGDF